MTTIAIITAVALAMIGAHITQRLVHKQELKDASDREYHHGYRDAITHDEKINNPLEVILRQATNTTRKDTKQ